MQPAGQSPLQTARICHLPRPLPEVCFQSKERGLTGVTQEPAGLGVCSVRYWRKQQQSHPSSPDTTSCHGVLQSTATITSCVDSRFKSPSSMQIRTTQRNTDTLGDMQSAVNQMWILGCFFNRKGAGFHTAHQQVTQWAASLLCLPRVCPARAAAPPLCARGAQLCFS